ncbi:MAG TPA: hypothetical protein VGL32_08175 [Acidimicrobiales bacterium]
MNRLGTDATSGVAAAAEDAAKHAGSLAGTAVSVTGSIVVGGASLMADGVVTLATVATGSSRHIVSPPPAAPSAPSKSAGKSTTKAGPAKQGSGAGSTSTSTGRRPSTTTKARKAPKSP